MYWPRFLLVARWVSLECRSACRSAIPFPFPWEALFEALLGMSAMGYLGPVPVLGLLVTFLGSCPLQSRVDATEHSRVE
jgi:hypothetical protein